MPIFKDCKSKNFTTIDNKIICNVKLSSRARFLLIYLLSKPGDWEVKFFDLVKQTGDGEYTVRSCLKELVNEGYLKLERGSYIDKDGKSKIGSWYNVYDEENRWHV